MALLELTVRNFAIIKHIELELNAGLTVITGETGAGKSVVLDALDLLLGSRAEAEMVRHGEDQCEITALFSIAKLGNVHAWLEARDLVNDDDEHCCLIRRVVRTNKPTKCYVNDQPATLASLKELGLMLVDLHGQHEHQSLMRVAEQRKIIDDFAEHGDSLKAMAKLASTINRLQRELNGVSQHHTDTSDRMELMSFQLDELDEASIVEGEFEALEQEYGLLSNASQLRDAIEGAINTLSQDDNSDISSDLGRQINNLSEFIDLNPHISEAHDLLNGALAQVEEAQQALSSALSSAEQNPERLLEVESRRDTLINLARKHRCAEDALPQRHAQLQSEYEQLKSQQLQPEKLEKEIAKLTQQYQKLASLVSAKRQQVAAQLSGLISEQMQDLGMKGGRLDIQVEQKISDQVIVSEHGADQIEFMVSTNHGMPLKALNKTASGGELSRISLAIQVITSEKSQTPTLVFDEVDVGVGGKVAEIVGTRLRNLGRNAQVLCITHQPQVAAQGQHHIFIDKVSTDKETFSTLLPLDGEMRVAEIARMLGGAVITDRTRAHAQEMLSENAS